MCCSADNLQDVLFRICAVSTLVIGAASFCIQLAAMRLKYEMVGSAFWITSIWISCGAVSCAASFKNMMAYDYSNY